MAYSTDIKDYYRRAWGLEDRPGFKYGGSWADWKVNYEDQMTFEEYLQDDNITKKPHFLDRKAKGGRIRGAGPLAIAPALAPGLAEALGISIATLGGWAGAQKVQNYIEENPEHARKVWSVLDPSTAIASTLTNLLKRPKDESKKEIVERIETIKKEPDQEPPKGPKWEDYFEIAEKATYDFAESRWKKKAIKSLKKHFDNKSWNEKPIITGSHQAGTRKSVLPNKNKWFFEGLNDYSKEKHGGNLKSAIRELSGETDQKKINSIYQSITQAGERRDYIFERGGKKLISDIKPSETIYKFTDLTTNLRENPKLLDERVESFDKNKVYNRKQLFDIFGIESEDRRTQNFVMEVLKDNGAKYFPLPGGNKGFKLKDAKKALDLYSAGKLKNWERRGEGSARIKRSDFREKWDPGISNFGTQLYRGMRKVFNTLKIGDTKLYLPNSTSEIGHNPIPISYGDQFDFLKNKKVKNKLFKLSNTTWQDQDINREILMDGQGKLLKPLNIIEKYWGKKVTKNNIKELGDAVVLLNSYYDDVSEKASKAAKESGFINKDVIGRLKFTVPQIGETVGEQSIDVDMSKVDPKFIIGNVDLINSDAIKYDDLSKDEKIMFGQNVIDQKIEQIKDFYKDAEYGEDIIEDMIEAFLVGHMGEGEYGKASTGLLERFLATQEKIEKKAEGGLSGVDYYIMNRYR